MHGQLASRRGGSTQMPPDAHRCSKCLNNTPLEEGGPVGNNWSGMESPQGKQIKNALHATAPAMVFSNTFTSGGGHYTYFQAKGKSRIDFIAVPRSFQGNMTSCYTLKRQGFHLQQNKKTPYNRDHVPVLCKYDYRLYFDDTSKLPEQPDVDLMMNAWLVGKIGRASCRERV